MGLGGMEAVSLRQARDFADHWRSKVALGIDPIRSRGQERQEAKRSLHLLKDVAVESFESRKAELKGDGQAGRWFSPLELHVLPKLGNTPITDIDQRHIRDAFAPIWHVKADTARKALNRLSIVMKHGAALGLNVDLLATEKAKALLGQTRHETTHIPSVPWAEVPAFYKSLTEQTPAHLGLRLLILTALRSGPIRHLRLDQIEGRIWTIPGEAMKGRKGKTPDFRVPLPSEAMRVIELAKPFMRDGFMFPSVRKGVMSDATMSRLMERRGMVERPHGFRASLRTWLAEATDAPHEVAEMMLAHASDSLVVRTYRKTDYLEQRAALLERWTDHVTGGSGQVVQLEAAQ